MPKSLRNKISFIEPMYALGVPKLPEGAHWLYEIKLDGYRCIAGKDASGVSLSLEVVMLMQRVLKAYISLSPDLKLEQLAS